MPWLGTFHYYDGLDVAFYIATMLFLSTFLEKKAREKCEGAKHYVYISHILR